MKSRNEHKSIQNKLLTIMGGVVFIGVVFMGWSAAAMNQLGALTQELVEADEELNEALEIRILLQEMEMLELSFVLSHDPEFVHAHEQLLSLTELYLRNSLIRTEEADLQFILSQIETEFIAYEGIYIRVLEAGEKNDWETAVSLGEESAAKIEKTTFQIDKIIEHYQGIVDDRVETANRNILYTQVGGYAAIGIYLILVILTARILMNQISNPIILMIEASKSVEENRFEAKALDGLSGRGDEVGRLARAFIQMSESFKEREQSIQEQIEEVRVKVNR